MENSNNDDLEMVTVDYEGTGMPESVKEFQPRVYKEGDTICCLFGPDPQAGIFGCGPTTEAALQDWDRHLHDRLTHHAQSDDFAEDLVALIAENQWSV